MTLFGKSYYGETNNKISCFIGHFFERGDVIYEYLVAICKFSEGYINNQRGCRIFVVDTNHGSLPSVHKFYLIILKSCNGKLKDYFANIYEAWDGMLLYIVERFKN